MIDTFRRIKRNKAQIRSCFKITHLTMNSYPKYIKNSQLKLNVRKWTKRLKKNRPKTPTDIKDYKQMSNKQTNKQKSFTWCVIREMWIETAMTTLCTNQNGQTQNTNNKMWYNRKLLLVSMQNGTATLEGHMAVS